MIRKGNKTKNRRHRAQLFSVKHVVCCCVYLNSQEQITPPAQGPIGTYWSNWFKAGPETRYLLPYFFVVFVFLVLQFSVQCFVDHCLCFFVWPLYCLYFNLWLHQCLQTALNKRKYSRLYNKNYFGMTGKVHVYRRVNSGAPDGQAVPAPLVAHVLL